MGHVPSLGTPPTGITRGTGQHWQWGEGARICPRAPGSSSCPVIPVTSMGTARGLEHPQQRGLSVQGQILAGAGGRARCPPSTAGTLAEHRCPLPWKRGKRWSLAPSSPAPSLSSSAGNLLAISSPAPAFPPLGSPGTGLSMGHSQIWGASLAWGARAARSPLWHCLGILQPGRGYCRRDGDGKGALAVSVTCVTVCHLCSGRAVAGTPAGIWGQEGGRGWGDASSWLCSVAAMGAGVADCRAGTQGRIWA